MTDRSHMGTQNYIHGMRSIRSGIPGTLDDTAWNDMLIMSLNTDVWFVVSHYHMMSWSTAPAPFDWFDWLCVGHTKQRSIDTFPNAILRFYWTHVICNRLIPRSSQMNRGIATGIRSKEAILRPLSKNAAAAPQHVMSTNIVMCLPSPVTCMQRCCGMVLGDMHSIGWVTGNTRQTWYFMRICSSWLSCRMWVRCGQWYYGWTWSWCCPLQVVQHVAPFCAVKCLRGYRVVDVLTPTLMLVSFHSL